MSRPGISVEHRSLPARQPGLVRCDVGGLISFMRRMEWPEGASAGDFVEVTIRRLQELEDHPSVLLFDGPCRRAARCFFENGGDQLYLFSVCIEDDGDIRSPNPDDGPLKPLFDRLRSEDDIALLACPSAAYLRCEVLRSGSVRSDADELYEVLLQHCQQMTNRFLIVDAPNGLHGDLLLRWFHDFQRRKPEHKAFGAMYYPWLRKGDAVFPPSGAVMGAFARNELDRPPWGVGWPPANIPLLGVTHTDVELDWTEVGIVGDSGINPFVIQPGRGVVIWGARTMSLDPRWLFINCRRVVSAVTEQLRRDNEWAVFEVNDPGLWKVIERDCLERLDEFWTAGLLSGTRPGSEFSVECNEVNNPMVARDSGQLNVYVRLRPVGTTERIFIDLRLGSPGS